MAGKTLTCVSHLTERWRVPRHYGRGRGTSPGGFHAKST